MNLEEFKQKLKRFSEKDIIVTKHALEQAEVRSIGIEEVKNNILHPDKLVFVEEQKTKNPKETKYNCYFAYREDYYHRYIMVLNGKLLIVTIIGINRKWQSIIEGKK